MDPLTGALIASTVASTGTGIYGATQAGGSPSGPQWPGLPFMGLSFVGFLIDLFRSRGRNREAQELQDRFLGSLGEYETMVLESGRDLPAFSYGGDIYGGNLVRSEYAYPYIGPHVIGEGDLVDPVQSPTGAQYGMIQDPEQQVINIDELFGGYDAMLEFFREAGPTQQDLTVPLPDIDIAGMREDITGTRTDIENILQGGLTRVTGAGGMMEGARTRIQEILERSRPGDILEGIEMPETDLSEVLSAQLVGIGAAGTKKEELAQQSLAALAPRYGGLENLRREQAALTSELGTERATAGQKARGEVRGRELAAQEFVSNLQAQAATEEAAINAALGQAQIASEMGITGIGAGAEESFRTALTSALSGMSGLDIGLGGLELNLADLTSRLQGENIERSIWNPFTMEMQLVGGAADAETKQTMFLLSQLTGMNQADLEQIMAAAGINMQTFATLVGGGMMDQMFPTFSGFIEGIGPR